jgi:hypothetical protein
MEQLIVRLADGDLLPEKVVYLCPSDTIEAVADTTTLSSPNFGLFVAMNAVHVTDESILKGAKKLLSKGLACVCAWGPDCKRVHDLFDVAAREINDELSGDDVIMTTWHDDESIEEALWHFIHSEYVTEKFEKTCKDWIIAPISNSEWEHLIRSKTARINSMTGDD